MTLEELVENIKNSSQHKFLYHFTDEANLHSINNRGILSKAIMKSEDWWPEYTGGNDLSHQLDDEHGISEYVSLCFTCNHQMKYTAHKDGRLPNPRYLKISPDVLNIEGTKIAFGIANSNTVDILNISEAVARLDYEVIYTRTDWSNPAVNQRLMAAEKFEILIPNSVPRNLITGVI